MQPKRGARAIPPPPLEYLPAPAGTYRTLEQNLAPSALLQYKDISSPSDFPGDPGIQYITVRSVFLFMGWPITEDEATRPLYFRRLSDTGQYVQPVEQLTSLTGPQSTAQVVEGEDPTFADAVAGFSQYTSYGVMSGSVIFHPDFPSHAGRYGLLEMSKHHLWEVPFIVYWMPGLDNRIRGVSLPDLENKTNNLPTDLAAVEYPDGLTPGLIYQLTGPNTGGVPAFEFEGGGAMDETIGQATSTTEGDMFQLRVVKIGGIYVKRWVRPFGTVLTAFVGFISSINPTYPLDQPATIEFQVQPRVRVENYQGGGIQRSVYVSPQP